MATRCCHFDTECSMSFSDANIARALAGEAAISAYPEKQIMEKLMVFLHINGISSSWGLFWLINII